MTYGINHCKIAAIHSRRGIPLVLTVPIQHHSGIIIARWRCCGDHRISVTSRIPLEQAHCSKKKHAKFQGSMLMHKKSRESVDVVNFTIHDSVWSMLPWLLLDFWCSNAWNIASYQVGDVSFRLPWTDWACACWVISFFFGNVHPGSLRRTSLIWVFFSLFLEWVVQPPTIFKPSQPYTQSGVTPFCCLWIFWFQELANYEDFTRTLDQDVILSNTFQ